MNELNCIRAFVKVVEVGSFAEASRQTDLAKSVITKRVNQLEEYLELQLLQRSTRKLNLTEGGAEFYEKSVSILAQLDQAKAEVSSVEWGLTGTLRVSCVSSFGSRYLATDLCEFQIEHPDLCVEFQQHDRFCDPTQEGFDVCIQVSSDRKSALEKVELFPLRRLLVATPHYLEKYGTPTTPEELTEHRHASNNYVNPHSVLDFMLNKQSQSVQINPQVLTNAIWMIRAAVMSDNYMALMPAFFIEDELASGQLVAVLTDCKIESPILAAFYRRSSFVPMKVRILISFLLRKYGDRPPWETRLLEKCPDLVVALGGVKKI